MACSTHCSMICASTLPILKPILHILAQRYETLQHRYGDDVVGGMETEEEKMQALADNFLNEDGTIKDEYKNTEEAKYLKDWQETQKLRPIVQKYEGRNDLTAEEQREAYDTASTTSLADNKNKLAISNSSANWSVLQRGR